METDETDKLLLFSLSCQYQNNNIRITSFIIIIVQKQMFFSQGDLILISFQY